MKSARILATPQTHQLRPMLEESLVSAGWQIVQTAKAGKPLPDLILALDVPLEAFTAACNATASKASSPPTGLAVHITTGKAASGPPSALPATPPSRDGEIRQLALAAAPHLRINAIATPSGGNIVALSGEILAAVMLFVECPAMTGVVITVDRPTGEQAAGQQQGQSRS